MADALKILVLLWLVNLAPPFLAHLLEGRWNAPLDRGIVLGNGEPLFGSHKTLRGVLAGVLTGAVFAPLFGIAWWAGLLAGALSMAGDLLSSFVKRRLRWPSGKIIPGLDQCFEGLFPLAVLAPYFSLGAGSFVAVFLLFCVGAYTGSWFLREVLMMEPFEDYPRPVRTRTRLREFRSCQITSHSLKYLLNFENAFYYHIFMKTVFRLLGVYEKGMQNALKIEERRFSLAFPDLPESFDGYRVLFLSDLHLDGLDGITEAVIAAVKDHPVDLCILGGDFRMETYGPFDKALARLRRIIPHIRAKDGILAVVGNHDCLEIVEPLRNDGITFLVNDSMPIRRDGSQIWFAGVDDPHDYKCHDLGQAFHGIPRGAFCILLAHSNEIYREAAAFRPRLYLCGHSHGGQIQVPPFGPLFTHSSAPRKYCEGVWHYNGMTGFTTGGVGVSGVPVRFNCRGEVSILTLRRKA
ncbi:MAG: CDP-archaeol synthase [Syntrophobacteraceae bacterium]|nr:CDP-archaeol synthase [Desulfobacteraceae bacterium]